MASFDEAPPGRNSKAGEKIFRTKCAQCHTGTVLPARPPIPVRPSIIKRAFDLRRGIDDRYQEIQKANREFQEALQKMRVMREMEARKKTFATALGDLTAKLKIMKMEQINLLEEASSTYKLLAQDMNEFSSHLQSLLSRVMQDAELHENLKVKFVAGEKKRNTVLTDIVAAFEILNCKNVQVQCQGTAPTVNVMVPGASEDADWVEHVLSEQYNHVFNDGKFETTPVSHLGA